MPPSHPPSHSVTPMMPTPNNHMWPSVMPTHHIPPSHTAVMPSATHHTAHSPAVLATATHHPGETAHESSLSTPPHAVTVL